jgi:hypothetical protein
MLIVVDVVNSPLILTLEVAALDFTFVVSEPIIM